MKEMKKILRYSKTGFVPQKQTHHMKDVNYHLYEFNLYDFPKHLQWIILEQHQKMLSFYQEHKEDFESGIWCFLDGFKNNQSLNHLKEKVPCWIGEIPSNTLVYDCNWQSIVSLNDSICEFGGFYLPEKEICKITNIYKQKKKNSYIL